MIRNFLLIAVLTFFVTMPSVSAQDFTDIQIQINETIQKYESDIIVEEDGTLRVTEKITVNAMNKEINHGIYRDFPTHYTGNYGLTVTKPFDILSIRKNGQVEKYKTESINGGVRIYIGDEDIIIPPGVYTYEIVYETKRQLGFFEDHDELFYNITGNGWSFPIAEAKTRITLPEKISLLDVKTKGYTGKTGSKEEAVLITKSTINGQVQITAETTRPLNAYEGFTMFVSFPKNAIPAPGILERSMILLFDNIPLVFGLVATLALLAYYILSWYLYGRDKGIRLTVPQFDSPDNIGAGAARYLTNMGFDTKSFTATLVNMAVKGYIRIFDREGGFLTTEPEYGVELIGNNKDKLTSEELAVADYIFKDGRTTYLFQQSDFLTVQTIIAQARNSLNHTFGKQYFINNTLLFVLALAPTIIFYLLLFIDATQTDGLEILILIFFVIWFVFTMVIQGTKKNTKLLGKIISIGIFIIFTIAFLFVGTILISTIGSLAFFAKIILAAIHPILHVIFYKALKARTQIGSELQNRIDGFKKYLTMAEAERIKLFNKELPKDIKTYEKFLPYAIAFDIETAWTKEFHDVIEAAKAAGYEPGWYAGHHYIFYSSNFTNSFSSSLESSISSSSADPSSSSGSGGGSGGGGGGGGGGGW